MTTHSVVYRDIQLTIRGEFEGRAFEADYSGEDGWNAGNGVQPVNPDDMEDYQTESYYDWLDRLTNYLWDNTQSILRPAV